MLVAATAVRSMLVAPSLRSLPSGGLCRAATHAKPGHSSSSTTRPFLQRPQDPLLLLTENRSRAMHLPMTLATASVLQKTMTAAMKLVWSVEQ
jgi:hypothetical protein